MDEDEVETVAQALYYMQENARGWQREPELLKRRFRRDACLIIAAVDTRRAKTVNPKTRVLVVEDDFITLQTAVSQLERAGFEVFEAMTGEEALQFLKTGVTVDVLFTDIRMPGSISGVEVARAYQEHFPSLHVVYGTAYVEEDLIASEARIFPKPYRMGHVVDFLYSLTLPALLER